jgi:hypothetical protein
MDEREFWTQVRRGLMTVVDVIERRYDLPRSTRYSWSWRPEPLNNGTTRERASSLSDSTKEINGR